MASLLSILEKIRNFDALPGDTLVEPQVSRVVRNSSEWRDRRLEKAGSPLVPPRIMTSPTRYHHRVEDIRRIVRGEVQAT
jgi:hypothetical protein